MVVTHSELCPPSYSHGDVSLPILPLAAQSLWWDEVCLMTRPVTLEILKWRFSQYSVYFYPTTFWLLHVGNDVDCQTNLGSLKPNSGHTLKAGYAQSRFFVVKLGFVWFELEPDVSSAEEDEINNQRDILDTFQAFTAGYKANNPFQELALCMCTCVFSFLHLSYYFAGTFTCQLVSSANLHACWKK